MTFEIDARDQGSGPAGGRSGRHRLRMIGVFIVVVAAVTAFTWATRSNDASTLTFDQPLTSVEIEVKAGTLTVVGGEDGPVAVEGNTDDGLLRAARITHRMDNGTLYVEGRCRGTWFVPAFGCRTDLTLRVPAGVTVTGVAAAGPVDAHHLSADTSLTSRAGPVTVSNQSGKLRAHSSAGNVVVTDLTSDEAHVTSSAGSVSVEARTPPRSLDAESSAGPVSVLLPRGHVYDVEAKSRDGSTTVDVSTSLSSVFEVRAFSSAGDVRVATR